MKTPKPIYRSPLGKYQPDQGPDPEKIKREGWRSQRILVISPDDDRLNWIESELLCRIGERLYGAGEPKHD
ncbi:MULTISPECIES: hypothetical protein [unclassified Hahella]|uniref:hypothetical protein n=1 Tax=unclassified Hahella TaxID=2624107 RepID=UPI001C1EE42C|nr:MULTISPECIES: hypothetical protein [unclassified Hahella]MBU6955998.1 hypothetical protein [Hahella sp. HN01]MDG9672241.1 hypothetical protein [Hahella sp. CR1]